MRHKIRAIKTRLNNPLRFLRHKNSIRRYLANDLTCAALKTTFRTRKRFHNKQYTPKSKDQPFESERTHFDIGFNNDSIAMHRPTIILFFLTKSQPFNKKQPTGTINQIKQSEKTISSINRKINHTNNHDKQSPQPLNKTTQRQPQQAVTKKCNVFEYYNIADGNYFQTNRKYAFYKNSTQMHKTKQHNLHSEVIIKQPRKSKTLFLDTMKPARKNV